MTDELERARQIAAEQAEDEGLWCVAETIMEAHLQKELRRLTEAVEGKSVDECAVAALSSRGDAGTPDLQRPINDIRTALSKLDSQRARNPGLPEVYTTISANAWYAIREIEAALAHPKETRRDAGTPLATDNTQACKDLFLRIKDHNYEWLAWCITDTQIAVICDAMEAWAEAATAHREGK